MDRRQQAKKQLDFARAYTNGLIEAFPEDKVLYQPSPDANHLLWQLGHLAKATNWAANLISADIEPYPQAMGKLFGGGSAPVSDASAYPTFAEVWAMFNKSYEALLDLVDSTPDAALDEPLPAESSYAAPNKFGLFAFTAWHEGFHAGQIASLRKALGLTPKWA